jgi:hypothetical protein
MRVILLATFLLATAALERKETEFLSEDGERVNAAGAKIDEAPGILEQKF